MAAGHLAPGRVWGAQSQVISSIHEVGSPYKVVFGEGAKRTKPGIYVRRGKSGRWGLAFPGALSSGRVKGTVVEQLGITQVTGGHESLFVLDGQLLLIGVESQQSRPKSFMVLGRGENPLYDPAGKHSFDMPLIEGVDDISVWTSEHNLTNGVISSPHQMVLVSVKLKNFPLGGGVTFGFILKSGDAKGSAYTLSSHNPMVVIDYSFYKKKHLNDLVFRGVGWGSNGIARFAASPMVWSQSLINYKRSEILERHKNIFKNWEPEVFDVQELLQLGDEEYFETIQTLEHEPLAYYSFTENKVLALGQVDIPVKVFGRDRVLGHTLQQSYTLSDESFRISLRPPITYSLASLNKAHLFGMRGVLAQSEEGEYLVGDLNDQRASTSHPHRSVGHATEPAFLFVTDESLQVYHESLGQEPIELQKLVLLPESLSYGHDEDDGPSVEEELLEKNESLIAKRGIKKLGAYLRFGCNNALSRWIYGQEDCLGVLFVSIQNKMQAFTGTRVYFLKKERGRFIVDRSFLLSPFFMTSAQLEKNVWDISETGLVFNPIPLEGDEAKKYYDKKTWSWPLVNIGSTAEAMNDVFEERGTLHWHSLPIAITHVEDMLSYREHFSSVVYKKNLAKEQEELFEDYISKGNFLLDAFHDSLLNTFSDKQVEQDTPETGIYLSVPREFANKKDPLPSGVFELRKKLTGNLIDSKDFDNFHVSKDHKKAIWQTPFLFRETMAQTIKKDSTKVEKELTVGVLALDQRKNALDLDFKTEDFSLFLMLYTENKADPLRPDVNFVKLLNSEDSGEFSKYKVNSKNLNYVLVVQNKMHESQKDEQKHGLSVSVILGFDKNQEGPDLPQSVIAVNYHLANLNDGSEFKFMGLQPLSEELVDYSQIRDRLFVENKKLGEAHRVFYVAARGDESDVFAVARSLAFDGNLESSTKRNLPRSFFIRYDDYLNGVGANNYRKKSSDELGDKAKHFLLVKEGIKAKDLEKNLKSGIVEMLFPQVPELLDELVSTQKKVILVTPDNIYSHTKKIIQSVGLSKRVGKKFSLLDSGLDLFLFSEFADQRPFEISNGHVKEFAFKSRYGQAHLRRVLFDIEEQIEKSKNSILYVDSDFIKNASRVEYKDSDEAGVKDDDVLGKHELNEYNLTEEIDLEDGKDDVFGVSKVGVEHQLPHVMYYLATQGAAVSWENLSEFKNKRPYSQLILMSESHWEEIQKDIPSETRYGLMNHFEVINLDDPDYNAQVMWAESVFNLPEIKRLGLRFEAKGLHRSSGTWSEETAKQQLLKYLVSKVHNLSKESNVSEWVSMNKVVLGLQKMLHTDDYVLQERVFNVTAVDKILSQNFNIPLKLEHLPEADFLHKVASDSFFQDMQIKGGYLGNLSVLQKLRRLILDQLSSVSAGRAVPASFILHGETGTGKTHLIKALADVLNLKPYNFNLNIVNKEEDFEKSGNADANMFFIKSEHLKNKKNLEDLLRHMFHFFVLSKNASRAFLFFDDVHIVPGDVRDVLMKVIRAIIGSENGMINAGSVFTVDNFGANKRGEEAKEYWVPVRNLVLGLTMNYTQEENLLKRYKGNSRLLIDERRILATLSTKTSNIESSFLSRFGALISLESFSEDALSLSLSSKLLDVAKNAFQTGQFVLVSPHVVDGLKKRFKGNDARGFLSEASSVMSKHIEEHAGKDSGLVIVKPQSTVVDEPADLLGSAGSAFDRRVRRPQVTNLVSMRDFFVSNAAVVSFDQSVDAKIYFIESIAASFRMRVLINFWDSFRLNSSSQSDLLLAKEAFLDHFKSFPYMPLDSLNVMPSHFGLGFDFSKEDFAEYLSKTHGVGKKLPEVCEFKSSTSVYGTLMGEVDEGGQANNRYNRKVVNCEYYQEIRNALKKEIARRLGAEGYSNFKNNNLTNYENWVQVVSADGFKLDVLSSDIGQILQSLFAKYIRDLYGELLEEVRNTQNVTDMSYYDWIRMYLLVLDHSILSLDWGDVMEFLQKRLSFVLQSVDYVNNKGLNNFLFFDSSSIMRPISSETLSAHLDSLETDVAKEKKLTDLNSRFNNKCIDMLSKKKAG